MRIVLNVLTFGILEKEIYFFNYSISSTRKTINHSTLFYNTLCSTSKGIGLPHNLHDLILYRVAVKKLVVRIILFLVEDMQI